MSVNIMEESVNIMEESINVMEIILTNTKFSEIFCAFFVVKNNDCKL